MKNSMRSFPISKWLWLALFLWAFLLSPLLAARIAYAAGPGTGGRRVRLDGEVAGPYTLRVVTSPTPPRIENLYVEVRVASTESGEVLDDVQVQVIARHEDQTEPSIQVEATQDIAPIPKEYAAHIPVDTTGIWSITIQVQGELGQGLVAKTTKRPCLLTPQLWTTFSSRGSWWLFQPKALVPSNASSLELERPRS